MTFIDVRQESEFAAGHLPGAVNIPMDQLESRLQDLPRDGPLMLVCQSGKRAEICSAFLGSRGFPVRVLQGGLNRCEAPELVSCRRTHWSLERQVRLGAGLIVLLSLLMAQFFGPGWLLLTAFAGCGLTFAGATGNCLLGSALARMPWNRLKTAPKVGA